MENLGEFVRKRHIRHLVHFTRLANLESILKRGLLPRIELEKLSLPFCPADQERGHGYGKQYCCLSIGFPNFQMFYKYRAQKDDRWLLLSIAAMPLLEDPEVLFVPDNTTASRMRGKALRGTEGLAQLYEDRFHPGGRRPRTLVTDYPSNCQAEVLYPKRIAPDQIDSVILESKSDESAAGKIIATVDRPPRIDTRHAFFEQRYDYSGSHSHAYRRSFR